MATYESFSKTKNGMPVYIQPQHSHTASHFADSPGLAELVKASLSKISATQENVQTDYDWGKPIGLTDLVTTTEADEVIYAKRPRRKTYARFVKHRGPAETSYVTVVLQKIEEEYLLISAWIGPSVPPFPGDRREWPESRAFWKRHALVYGRQRIDEATVTKECPW